MIVQDRLANMQPTLPRVPRMLGQAQPTWGELAERWLREGGRQIAVHPLATLSTGFAIGVFLGWLVKRR